MLEQPELKQDFLKFFNTIAHHKHRFDVFKDFVIISAISLHNAVRFNQELEDEYLTTIKSYSNEDLGSLAKLLGILTHMLEPKPFDALGQIYMDLGFGDARKGQFFTPPSICEIMAELSYGDKIKEDDFITLSEPACGGGGMILAFVHLLIKKGFNPANKLWVEAIDLDRASALMCYIQLSLWNIPARVIVGNALTLEIKETFYTPAHYLYFWDGKLRDRFAENKELEGAEIVSENSELSCEKFEESKKENVDPIMSSKTKKDIGSGQQTIFDLF